MFSALILLAVGLVRDDWSTYEPESGACRVALPSEPDETTSRSVAGPAGPIRVSTARLKAADGVYSIRVAEGAARVDPKTLDEGIRRFASSKKATLGPLRPIIVGGDPGREFEMAEGQKRSKVRFVASGKALIVISAAGMPGAGPPAGADRFLGSLETGPSKEVAEADPAPNPNPTPTAQASPAPKSDEAEKARAELAKVKAEAELARVKAEAELAKIKAEAELAKVKAEAELARAKAKNKDDFGDAPDASVMVSEAEKADKADDEPKDAAKAPAKKSNAPTRVTISRMPRDAKPYADQEIEDLSRSLARGRDGFRDVGPEGSVLVGVRVTFIERGGGMKVRSAQPIYRSGKAHYAGQIHGEAVGPTATFVARPGYAVGGLVTHTGLTVDGFGIVFMKVDGNRLDPSDTYKSPWIGDRNGGGPGEVMSQGGLVVGLQGRSKTELNAIGLTAVK